MEPVASKNTSESFILRALATAGTEAWCFVPANDHRITHCSRSFLTVWSASLEPPDQTGVPISLLDPRLVASFRHHGLDDDWLRGFVFAHDARLHNLPDSLPLRRVRRVVLSDDLGGSIGVMITCERRDRIRISTDTWHRASESQAQLKSLSPRESEILSLVFEGLTNKAAGYRAGISEKTVEKHRANIMRKLGATSIAQLVRCVTEAKMLQTADHLGSDDWSNPNQP